MLAVIQGHPLLKHCPPAASRWRLAPGASQPLSFPRGGVKSIYLPTFLLCKIMRGEGLCVLPQQFFFLPEIRRDSSRKNPCVHTERQERQKADKSGLHVPLTAVLCVCRES